MKNFQNFIKNFYKIYLYYRRLSERDVKNLTFQKNWKKNIKNKTIFLKDKFKTQSYEMNDILSFHILQRVNPSDLLNCALVCKEWNSIISSFDFIRRYCKKNYVFSYSRENKRTDLVILKFLYELSTISHLRFDRYYDINSIYYSNKIELESLPTDKLRYFKYLKFTEKINTRKFYIREDDNLYGYRIILYSKDKYGIYNCRQFNDSKSFIIFINSNKHIEFMTATYDLEQKLININSPNKN